jgi:hypothetical protein
VVMASLERCEGCAELSAALKDGAHGGAPMLQPASDMTLTGPGGLDQCLPLSLWASRRSV